MQSRALIVLLLLAGAVVLAAGCMGPAGNNPDFPRNLTVASPEVKTTPVFPVPPAPLSGQFLPLQPIASFEDSFIGSPGCSEGPESYSTNFTLITGPGGPQRINYTLVPVSTYFDLRERSASPDIMSARIEPDDFIAEPSTLYTSRFTIIIGPNVTGESGPAGGNAVYEKNPSYTYLVKVTVNGTDAPALNDSVNVIKWCYLHSQTRDMQGSPSWDLESHEVNISAGQKKAVNISLRNFGGGIRQIQFRVPARLKGSGFIFPLESDPDQTLPVPEGINFTFAKPVMTERNFQPDSNTLIIAAAPGTLQGVYHFPLEQCYRDLDSGTTSSPGFPFSNTWWCPSCGDFFVTVGPG